MVPETSKSVSGPLRSPYVPFFELAAVGRPSPMVVASQLTSNAMHFTLAALCSKLDIPQLCHLDSTTSHITAPQSPPLIELTTLQTHPTSGPATQSYQPLIYTPSFLSWLAFMSVIDIFNLILSFLDFYGIVFSLRLLLPRNIVPLVLTSLNEAMASLEYAKAINIFNVGDYWANLAMCVSLHTASPLLT
jgi:hypothetical protein